MRYLILICTAVAVLLLSPLHRAVASPMDSVGDCQSVSHVAGPCALVAPELSIVVDAQQPYANETMIMQTASTVRAPEVLLCDFDGVASSDLTLVKASTTSKSTIAKIDRCVAYGEAGREAVPRRAG